MKKIISILAASIFLSACSSVDLVEETPANEDLSHEVDITEEVLNKTSDDEVLTEELEDYIYYKEEEGIKGVMKVPFLKELPDSKVIEERPFDSCGEEEKYKESPWFDPLVAHLKEVSQKPEYKELGGSKIEALCLSSDGEIIIGMYSYEYCSSGFVFRYDVNEDLVEVAKFLDEYRIGCQDSFYEFGKRQGSIIPIKAVFGDAGCKSDSDFDYDFTKNTLKKRKACWGCYNSVDTDGDGKLNLEAEPVYEVNCEEY